MNEMNSSDEFQEESVIQDIKGGTQKKNKKPIFIIGGIVLLLIVVGIVKFLAFGSTPMGEMQNAYATTMAQNLKGGGPFDRATGFSQAYAKTILGNSSEEGNIVLKEVIPDTSGSFNELKDAGIYFEAKRDIKNKQLFGSIGVMISKLKLFGLDIYGDEENLMFASPMMYAGYLSVPLKNFGQAYNNSYIGRVEGVPLPDDYSVTLFEDDFLTSNFSSVFTKENLTLINDFYDSINVEKADSKKITVSGKEQACKGYSITMDGAKIKEIVKAYCELLKKNESFVGMIDYISKASPASKTQIENDIISIIESIESLNFSDIQFTCYVDHKNIIREFSHTSTIGYDGSDRIIAVTANGSFLGEENSFDVANVKINLDGEEEEETLSIIYDNNSKLDKTSGIVTTNTKISFGEDLDFLHYVLNSNYDTKNGTYDMTLDLDANNEEEISVISKGTIEIKEKGSTFHIIADELSFDLGDANKVSLSGEYKLEPFDGTIEKPEQSEIRALFDMKESDFGVLMSEIYSGVMKTFLAQ